MSLYAISDLHLSFNVDKPMDIFGDKWALHERKIESNWSNLITDEDTVLIAGDISWGMKESESKDDLNWINNLPGRKIISKGNHDYWWGSISKLNSSYDKIKFIQNNFYTYKDYAICGTRGWICPGSDKFTEKDKKIYDRELIRLELSLSEAVKNGYEKFIVMIHYPPVNEKFQKSGFLEIFEKYKVKKVIYGHLHGMTEDKLASELNGNIEYIMTSCDYLDFCPKKIL
ncbi:MAG: metallophosphoesterase [Clostridiales bacterium]|nr:metallophosphoesterase [Clostridiales bacterium]MDY2730138.1 metallophosphoesterase [Clostridium sp.]